MHVAEEDALPLVPNAAATSACLADRALFVAPAPALALDVERESEALLELLDALVVGADGPLVELEFADNDCEAGAVAAVADELVILVVVLVLLVVLVLVVAAVLR